MKIIQLILMVFCLSAGKETGLVFEEKVLDLSKQQRQRLTGIFTFINTSSQDITIKKVRTSCGCMQARSDKKVYKPNERGIITVSILNPKFSLRKHIIISYGSVKKGMTLAITVKRKLQPVRLKTLNPQAVCPYMGLKIANKFHFSYKNRVIFTCCKDCLVAVKANPEQAIKNLASIGQRPLSAIEADAKLNGFE